MGRPSLKPTSRPQIVVTNDLSVPPHKFPGPFRPIWCAKHHFIGPWPCDCPPGPQTVLMNPLVVPGLPVPDEITVGGARGGSKSASLLAVAGFRGNPAKLAEAYRRGTQPTMPDLMYTNHRNYRALILRPQSADLGDLLERAQDMYSPLGAVITKGSTPMAEWPSGAKIIFGHFLDDGWRKYIGQEYQFIGIDQIEMMPLMETYHRILGSLRSPWPELKAMAMSTFNPGGGEDSKGAPGQGWLMEYFRIEAYLNGIIPTYGAVRDEQGKIRMFIQSKVQHNPYLFFSKPTYVNDGDAFLCSTCEGVIPVPMPKRPDDLLNVCPLCQGKLLADGAYLKWLRGIEPESLRRAWLDGDMLALSGAYFREYRPNGPGIGEPENARHVYDPVVTPVEDWWHCWGAIDWGYIHPTDIQFARKSPDGRTYIFKEISIKRMEPVELGVLIARECAPILEAFKRYGMPQSLNFYLSPDAFAKRESENTVASQIATGIRKVFGANSVFTAELSDEEKALRNPEEALKAMLNRRQAQQSTRITLIRANNDRVAGWMHLQTLMRFRPLQGESVPDTAFADKLYQEKGLVAYKQYMNQPEFSAKREVLPKLQISKDCVELRAAIPKAMHKVSTSDLEKFDATETAGGDDPLDSCFIAGTEVLTERGFRRIEDLRAGEKVWTRDGLREVAVWKQVGVKPVIEVEFSDGRSLIGTAEHPIFVGDDWKRLDSLRYGDILYPWQKSSSLTESSFAGTLNQSAGTYGSITGLRGTTGIEASVRFIKRFGKTLMGRFPKGIISTTKMKIRSITRSKIWKQSLSLSISASTEKLFRETSNIWPEFALSPSSGIGLRTAGSGIVSMPRNLFLKRSLRRRWFASTAVRSIHLATKNILSFAGAIANRVPVALPALIPFLCDVWSAVKNSTGTNMSPKDTVLKVVGLKRRGNAVVYNLEVSGKPEYFANGVLVHNCRYLCFSEEMQGESFPPLEKRIESRAEAILNQYPGLSDHSRIMIKEHARYVETKGKNAAAAVSGANRVAARRAMLQNQAAALRGVN